MVKLLEVISYSVKEALNEELDIRQEGSGRNRSFIVFDNETGEELERFTGRNAEGRAEEFRDNERAIRAAGSGSNTPDGDNPDRTSGNGDTPGRPPAGTQLDLDGKTYEFRGRMWVEVNTDGSYGRPAGRAAQTELNGFWEETRGRPQGSVEEMDSARRGNVDLETRARYWTGSSDRGFFVKIGSHAFKFESQGQADRFIESWNAADRTARRGLVDRFVNARLGAGGRFVEGWRSGGFQSLEDAIDRIPGARTILNSRALGFVFRIFEIFGWSTALLHSHVANVAYWKDQVSQGELSESDAEDLIMSSQAALGAQITILCTNMFRSVRRIRLFISGARVISNMWAAVMAGTGVGLPGAIALIAARETGFFLIQWMLTRPSFQRKIAEFVAGFLDYTIARVLIESLAAITGQGLAALSAALDEVGLGFDNLIRDGGWEYSPSESASQDVYASTEWAKLVFQDVLFPPDRNFEVPYIPTGERRRLLQSTLASMYDLQFEADSEGDPTQELGTPENPRPIASGQLGMINDYVFAFSQNEYQRLRDTHEVVVLNDVMGQRPGTDNQLLFLAPTAETLANGQNIPTNDNPVITSSGQLIDRPEPENDNDSGLSVDDIADIANTAIDNAGSVNSGAPGFR